METALTSQQPQIEASAEKGNDDHFAGNVSASIRVLSE